MPWKPPASYVRKSVPVSVDRTEGDCVVFVAKDGRGFNAPAAMFPDPPRDGDVYVLVFSPEATRACKAESAKVQDELRARDPGGDVIL